MQRSALLFGPGDRPERLDKAWDSEADEITLDLEDAAAPARKQAARESVEGWLRADRPVWLRLNAVDTGAVAGAGGPARRLHRS